jgi:hypothetical protein
MSTFIASPTKTPDAQNSIDLILFDDSGHTIGQGGRSFFETILQDLRIPVKPKNWNLRVCRSDYFSDYLGEDDWRDVWRPTWKCRIVVDKNIDNIPLLPDIFIESKAVDDTWDHENRVKANSITNCLVISDFDSLEKLDAASKAIRKIAVKQASHYLEQKITLEVVTIIQNLHQLHIDLGKVTSDFYLSGAEDATQIQSICKTNGGTVHFQSRFP